MMNSGSLKQSGGQFGRMENEFGITQSQGFGKSPLNQTQGSMGTNPASLKGKLMNLEVMILLSIN